MLFSFLYGFPFRYLRGGVGVTFLLTELDPEWWVSGVLLVAVDMYISSVGRFASSLTFFLYWLMTFQLHTHNVSYNNVLPFGFIYFPFPLVLLTCIDVVQPHGRLCCYGDLCSLASVEWASWWMLVSECIKDRIQCDGVLNLTRLQNKYHTYKYITLGMTWSQRCALEFLRGGA